MQQTARRRANVDQPETRPVYFIMLGAVLLREGHVQVAADVLDIEGRESPGNALVPEGIPVHGDRIEIRVVDVNTPFSNWAGGRDRALHHLRVRAHD
jgi:hypothetical protein